MDAQFESYFDPEEQRWFWRIIKANGGALVRSTTPLRFQADQMAEIDMVLAALQAARARMVDA